MERIEKILGNRSHTRLTPSRWDNLRLKSALDGQLHKIAASKDTRVKVKDYLEKNEIIPMAANLGKSPCVS